jgi:hypothetical protein
MTRDIRQLLVQRLTVKGLDKNLISGFLRCLANSIDVEQRTDFRLINKHMRNIGWDDIDLDYHTFELARNCFEAEGFTDDEYKTSKWYKRLVSAD